MPTTKLNLPLIDGTNTADVVRDMNALANAVDNKVGVPDGLATLDASGKVPVSQLNVSAPADATTTVKGIVMLEDSVTSTSVTKAATPKNVKQAYDLANAAIPMSQKSQPNGVASLGADGKVPPAQLPTLASTATDITVTDTANYYTSTNVEGALAELGQTLNGTRANLVTTAQALGVM